MSLIDAVDFLPEDVLPDLYPVSKILNRKCTERMQWKLEILGIEFSAVLRTYVGHMSILHDAFISRGSEMYIGREEAFFRAARIGNADLINYLFTKVSTLGRKYHSRHFNLILMTAVIFRRRELIQRVLSKHNINLDFLKCLIYLCKDEQLLRYLKRLYPRGVVIPIRRFVLIVGFAIRTLSASLLSLIHESYGRRSFRKCLRKSESADPNTFKLINYCNMDDFPGNQSPVEMWRTASFIDMMKRFGIDPPRNAIVRALLFPNINLKLVESLPPVIISDEESKLIGERGRVDLTKCIQQRMIGLSSYHLIVGAVTSGSLKLVKYMYARFDPDDATEYLQLARNAGHEEVVSFLLQRVQKTPTNII